MIETDCRCNKEHTGADGYRMVCGISADAIDRCSPAAYPQTTRRNPFTIRSLSAAGILQVRLQSVHAP